MEQVKAEAESLPKLTLTKLDTQWLQVRFLAMKMKKSPHYLIRKFEDNIMEHSY